MLFNSVEYLLFFTFVLLASWALIGLPRVRIWMLLLASYYFYISNNHWLIVLILVSTQIDYIAAIRIEDTKSAIEKRFFLMLSLCANLGILGFFKYFNFFAGTMVSIVEPLGIQLSWVDLNITLPVGISFYTFQSMSYSIEVYRGGQPAERSWHRFAFFVAFFPQLVAGPIVRSSTFMPQIDNARVPSLARIESGLQMIFLGLFKKIVLADYLGVYADAAFNDPSQIDALTALVGVYAFTFQIYFDFSGYSDIAIGCSRLIGFELPINFNRPYMSANITEFWRRWHISLSTWLRDYLYISLGGNRMSTRFGTYRNLMLTMLLGGLWHGAAMHFVIWGGLQGLFLVFERATGIGRQRDSKRPALRRAISIFVTFHLVCLSWIVFRADSSRDLADYLRAFGDWAVPAELNLGIAVALAIVAGGWLAQWWGERRPLAERFVAFPVPVKALAYAVAAVSAAVFGSGTETPFIYFRF